MTAFSPDCVQQDLLLLRSIGADPTRRDVAQTQLTVDRIDGGLRGVDRQTPTTQPRRMLSYSLIISYARPIVLSCTALHGGHQTMKWGV